MWWSWLRRGAEPAASLGMGIAREEREGFMAVCIGMGLLRTSAELASCSSCLSYARPHFFPPRLINMEKGKTAVIFIRGEATLISFGKQTSMVQQGGRKCRYSGRHPIYCPAHGVSDHLRIARLCVHVQGKPKLSIGSRDIAVLGTRDLLEMRGTWTVLKSPRKDAFLDWALLVSKA